MESIVQKPSPHLLPPVRHFISEDGRYCLVYHRNDSNISQHLAQINTVQDLLRFLTQCSLALAHLPSGLCPHGNIHPNNIFWNGKHIQFMDPMTPLLRKHHQELLHKVFNKYTSRVQANRRIWTTLGHHKCIPTPTQCVYC